jgi:hypothetical protein
MAMPTLWILLCMWCQETPQPIKLPGAGSSSDRRRGGAWCILTVTYNPFLNVYTWVQGVSTQSVNNLPECSTIKPVFQPLIQPAHI